MPPPPATPVIADCPDHGPSCRRVVHASGLEQHVAVRVVTAEDVAARDRAREAAAEAADA